MRAAFGPSVADVFVLGAGFSAYQGIESLLSPGEEGSPTWAFVVLGVSFVFEGASFVKALVQLRGDARDVRRVTAPHPDEFEEIDVVAVPAEDLRQDLGTAAPRYVTDVNSALVLKLALARLGGER